MRVKVWDVVFFFFFYKPDFIHDFYEENEVNKL